MSKKVMFVVLLAVAVASVAVLSGCSAMQQKSEQQWFYVTDNGPLGQIELVRISPDGEKVRWAAPQGKVLMQLLSQLRNAQQGFVDVQKALEDCQKAQPKQPEKYDKAVAPKKADEPKKK